MLKLQASKQVVSVEFVEKLDPASFKTVEFIENVEPMSGNLFLLHSKISEDIRPLLLQFAVNNGLTIVSLHQQEKQLEDIFHQLTAGQ